MRLNKKVSSRAFIVITLIIQPALSKGVLAADTRSAPPEWSVQVMKVDAGDIKIEAAFRVAIYENLLVALSNTKEFKQVLRDGDRTGDGRRDVLILKSKVESYTPGSETKRAVTTVSGGTKLRVRTQLCTREGQVVLERVSSGNVRFFGGNLRVTQNLARNVAKGVKQSSLSDLSLSSGNSKTSGLARFQWPR